MHYRVGKVGSHPFQRSNVRILLVEDDDLIGSGVLGLRHVGFAVDRAPDGRQAKLALETTDYALIVLDLGLPRVAGTELLKWLRADGNDVPVLVLVQIGSANRLKYSAQQSGGL